MTNQKQTQILKIEQELASIEANTDWQDGPTLGQIMKRDRLNARLNVLKNMTKGD